MMGICFVHKKLNKVALVAKKIWLHEEDFSINDNNDVCTIGGGTS